MKLLTTVVLLAAVAFIQAASPVPGYAGEQEAKSSHDSERQPDGQKENAAPSSRPDASKSKQPAAPPSANPSTAIQRPGNKEESLKIVEVPPLSIREIVSIRRSWADWGYWAFTMMLVVVGLFQVWILGRQARILERQAKLQEVSVRQWVNMRNWACSLSDRKAPPDFLDVRFDIANCTRLPLTLHEVGVTFIGGEQYRVSCTHLLAPDALYQIAAPFELTSEQKSAYLDSKLVLEIDVSVIYEDILGSRQDQPSGFRCLFSPSGVSLQPRPVRAPRPASQQPKKEKDDKTSD